jgi:hypothetical protein
MKSDHLNHFRIASPCPANWESVVGLMLAPELIETSGKPIINEQFLRRRPR